MKKVTLLLMILCASALNGMETTKQREHGHYVGLGMGDLPKEVQILIITYLNEYKDPNDIIKTLKATSRTNKQLRDIIEKEYGNQEGFTALVHMLANKFNLKPIDVAIEFKTPAAQQYIKLHNALWKATFDRDTNTVAQLIKEGADINSKHVDSGKNLLNYLLGAFIAGSGGNKQNNMKALEILKMILNAGATINKDDLINLTEREKLYAADANTLKRVRLLKKLLEDAMSKQ